MEYIEREDAVAVIEEKQKELCPVGRYGRGYVYGSDREKYDNWDEIIDALENLPAADVVPVVHGLWVKGTPNPYCSECFVECRDETTFCPNCGAKMDGGNT